MAAPKKKALARRRHSPSAIREDGHEIIGMIQTSGIHRVEVRTAACPMAHNIPPGEDHREVHLEIRQDGCVPKTTSMSRGRAEALIGLLRAAIETL